MAAGVIYQTVTTTTGETVELAFYVDDTVTPTTWIPVRVNVNASGSPVAFGSGANGSTVPRVALATDSPGVIATGTIGNGNLSATILSVDTPANATSIAKLEDAASADGDKGVPAMAVRKATPANTSGTDGDYEFLQVSAGRLWVSDSPSMANFGAGEYETVAASQTAQVLGATGATGDYISGILVVPATTSPGNVLLLDNATSITVFAGGASSVSNLVPFFIPLGMISVSGAWKITTGANVSCIGIGNFT